MTDRFAEHGEGLCVGVCVWKAGREVYEDKKLIKAEGINENNGFVCFI